MSGTSSLPERSARSEGGLFLAFEGVEGSGKSTQAALLAEYLRNIGRGVVHAREPGSTELGERIRSLVLDEAEVGIPARSELFLMLAARAAFVDQVVRPGLADGSIVIADRFELSTMAYQGAGRGLPVEAIELCNQFATSGISPDATVFLELSAEEGAARQVAAAKRPDRMEREARDFHHRVARGYADFAAKVRGILRVDARGSVEHVHANIIAVLEARFPETFGPGRFIS